MAITNSHNQQSNQKQPSGNPEEQLGRNAKEQTQSFPGDAEEFEKKEMQRQHEMQRQRDMQRQQERQRQQLLRQHRPQQQQQELGVQE